MGASTTGASATGRGASLSLGASTIEFRSSTTAASPRACNSPPTASRTSSPTRSPTTRGIQPATSSQSASPGSRTTLTQGPRACCEVGLDRPRIPTVFAANLSRSPRVFRPRRSAFRSARVSRPRRFADRRSPGDASPAGDWETVGRRGRAGQEIPARTTLRGTWFKPRMAMGTNRRP